eukprot:scaffold12195_cov126-Cylindrotheca_fusiformis.AAC.1
MNGEVLRNEEVEVVQTDGYREGPSDTRASPVDIMLDNSVYDLVRADSCKHRALFLVVVILPVIVEGEMHQEWRR